MNKLGDNVNRRVNQTLGSIRLIKYMTASDSPDSIAGR